MTPTGLLIPAGAGLLSFMHPCVWPLVPGYLSFLTGNLGDEPVSRWQASRQALWFALGSTLVLTGLGAAVAAFGATVQGHQVLIEQIGGVLLVLCGLAFTGVVSIPWLSRDHRPSAPQGAGTWWRSVVVGGGFGLSWSACTGPVLAGLLLITAVRSHRVAEGVATMLTFGLGQSIPFVAMALAADRIVPILRRWRRFSRAVSVVGGVTLILLGALLLSGQFSDGSPHSIREP